MKSKVFILVLGLMLPILPAQASQVSYKDATTALNVLKVADESRTGYVRSKFKHWISAGNGCDARKAVIISEAVKKPTEIGRAHV